MQECLLHFSFKGLIITGAVINKAQRHSSAKCSVVQAAAKAKILCVCKCVPCECANVYTCKCVLMCLCLAVCAHVCSCDSVYMLCVCLGTRSDHCHSPASCPQAGAPPAEKLPPNHRHLSLTAEYELTVSHKAFRLPNCL